MIADASVTMSSPWLSDDPTSEELLDEGFDLDLDINAFEADISRMHRPVPDSQSDMYGLLSCLSRGTSVAGSDCSDDLYVDIDSDEMLFCDLQASILNIIDDNSDSNILSLDNIELVDSDWNLPRGTIDFDNQSVTSDYSSASSSCSKSSSENTCSKSSSENACSKSNRCSSKNTCNKSSSSSCSKSSNGTKSSNKNCIKNLSSCKSPSKSKEKVTSSSHNKHTSPLMGRKRQNSQSTDGRRWSDLSSGEQVHVVEELSHVISSEMGLREQLEVIRIINPSAKVAPNDREFVIDLEMLDDNKLQKIEEYVKLHISCSTTDMSSDFPQVSQKRSTKRQKCQERRNQQKMIKQRQRKEYRQMMKERRSGLFVKEEVMALSVTADPGEEDVDVLM